MILTGCDFVIAFAHDSCLSVGVHSFGAVELRVKQIDLLLSESLLLGLTLLFLPINVVADVVDLALSLLDRRVQLHRLLRRVLQILLQVGHLARQFTLG